MLDGEVDPRWSTRKPPELFWSEHVWPASGLYGDQFWAAMLRVTVRHFHSLVAANGWNHLHIGRVIFVEAAYLAQQLADLPSPLPTRSKRKK